MSRHKKQSAVQETPVTTQENQTKEVVVTEVEQPEVEIPVKPQEVTKSKETAEVSKSQMIRDMYHDGKTISEIAKTLGIRYNFAYNVIQRYQQINGIEKPPKEPSKAQQIRDLFKEGKTVSEIKKLLGLDYGVVYQVVHKMKGGRKP